MSNFNFENFITKIPPYVKVDLEAQDVLNLSEINLSKIEEYCMHCDKEQTFIYKKDDSSYMSDLNGSMSNGILLYAEAGKHIQDQIDDSSREIYKDFDYYCAKCGERHEYFFTSDRKYIMKVGQNPSFSDLQGEEINKYKNLISKYFIEFKSSLSCYSQKKGIAAFVYLRRILENIIEKKYKEFFSEETNIKFIDKFSKVQEKEKIIPKELESVRNQLYSVLSKGIHEYNEQECLDIYEIVKFVIEEILDKQLEDQKKEEKIKKVKETLIAKSKEKKNGWITDAK